MALVKAGNIAAIAAPFLNSLAWDASEDFVICKSPEKLQALLAKVKHGCCVHYISDGDWSMHDIVMELIKTYKPADVFITTYALREFPMRQLILAQDRGDINKIFMLLDYRAKARTPEVYHMAAQNVNKIVMTSIHAKVTVINSPLGNITIVGSANWTQNPRIEAGVITMDNSVAEFHKDWIEKVMNDGEIFE